MKAGGSGEGEEKMEYKEENEEVLEMTSKTQVCVFKDLAYWIRLSRRLAEPSFEAGNMKWWREMCTAQCLTHIAMLVTSRSSWREKERDGKRGSEKS